MEEVGLIYEINYNGMGVEFSELIQSDTPTFVDFSAEWYGPCKMMAPILGILKTKVGDSLESFLPSIYLIPSI